MSSRLAGVQRLGFVMEQTLGHVTHACSLQPWVCGDAGVEAEWLPVPFDARDMWQRIPVVRANWTLRAGLRAGRMVARARRRRALDGLFFHTQVTAVLLSGLMRRIPSVVSLDATPVNVDSLAAAYGHRPSPIRPLEAIKNRLNRRVFHGARRLVTWCDWAKRSLVADYGVPESKVAVIPPGVDLSRLQARSPSRRPADRIRLLFVGGDFQRKGGPLLLGAFRRMPECCELDIVTRDANLAPGGERIRIHRGLSPNSPALLGLFTDADVFVFPTTGDCLPIAVMEAMAAGLPVVASRVGAIDEEVVDGVTGLLVPPGDEDALVSGASALAADFALRQRMGRAARERAEEHFDASRNYPALLALCKECADAAA